MWQSLGRGRRNLLVFWLLNRDWRLKKQRIFTMLLSPHRKSAKIQCNITTSLTASLSETGFGLDELVCRMEGGWGGAVRPVQRRSDRETRRFVRETRRPMVLNFKVLEVR